MKRCNAVGSRRGLSLLEMMMATALMATLMASVVVLVRGGYAAWDEYEQDLDISENGYATLRHITRRLRQASSITAISDSSATSGSISALMSDSSTYTWDHDSATDDINFDTGSGNQLLSWKIDELTFIGYEADGTTPTTTVADIRLVESRVKVTLPHGTGVPVTLSTKTWIRSW